MHDEEEVEDADLVEELGEVADADLVEGLAVLAVLTADFFEFLLVTLLAFGVATGCLWRLLDAVVLARFALDEALPEASVAGAT